MDKVLVTETYLENIGDALREVNGSTNTYTVQEMSSAIRTIATGSAGLGVISTKEDVLFDESEYDNCLAGLSVFEADFSSYEYVKVYFISNGVANPQPNSGNAINKTLTIDLTKPSANPLLYHESIDWRYGVADLYPDAQFFLGETFDPGFFMESAFINADKTKLLVGKLGFYTISSDLIQAVFADRYMRVSKIIGVRKNVISTSIYDMIYPIGSIYMSINETDPSLLFGGTWERISQGRTLIGYGTGTDGNGVSVDFTPAESQGGEYQHTLTVDEMPSHNHQVYNDNGGGYNLDVYTAVNGQKVGYPNNIYTTSAGGSKAHNNVQPFFVVHMWKRIS